MKLYRYALSTQPQTAARCMEWLSGVLLYRLEATHNSIWVLYPPALEFKGGTTCIFISKGVSLNPSEVGFPYPLVSRVVSFYDTQGQQTAIFNSAPHKKPTGMPSLSGQYKQRVCALSQHSGFQLEQAAINQAAGSLIAVLGMASPGLLKPRWPLNVEKGSVTCPPALLLPQLAFFHAVFLSHLKYSLSMLSTRWAICWKGGVSFTF